MKCVSRYKKYTAQNRLDKKINVPQNTIIKILNVENKESILKLARETKDGSLDYFTLQNFQS